MGEAKVKLLAANGSPIESPEEKLTREQHEAHVNELMTRVNAAMGEPNSNDYLLVGINLMQAFIFGGGAIQFAQRFEHATGLLGRAVEQTLQNKRLNESVAAGLKQQGLLN